MATFGFNTTALRATQPMFRALFLKISLSAEELMSFSHQTPLDYYLWGAVKDKCYAGKPETIDALKDNIRKTVDEI